VSKTLASRPDLRGRMRVRVGDEGETVEGESAGSWAGRTTARFQGEIDGVISRNTPPMAFEPGVRAEEREQGVQIGTG